MKYQTFSSDLFDAHTMYKLMVSTIIPRPIAWVSTLNNDDSVNVAPFSFFNGVTGNPPTLMVSVARKSTGEFKDTHVNITARKEFVVNMVPNEHFDAMVDSAAAYEYGISEVEKLGLTTMPSEGIKTPRIGQTAVQFECKLMKAVDIGEGDWISATVFFGKIMKLHINADLILDNNRIDFEKFNPVGRVGGVSYTNLGKLRTKIVPQV